MKNRYFVIGYSYWLQERITRKLLGISSANVMSRDEMINLVELKNKEDNPTKINILSVSEFSEEEYIKYWQDVEEI